MKKVLLTILVAAFIANTDAQDLQYPDVLNMKASVKNQEIKALSFFSDLGAWHAYALPGDQDGYGGFVGPLLMGS